MPKFLDWVATIVDAFSTLNSWNPASIATPRRRNDFVAPMSSCTSRGNFSTVPAGTSGTISDVSTIPGITSAPGVHGRPAQPAAVYRVVREIFDDGGAVGIGPMKIVDDQEGRPGLVRERNEKAQDALADDDR